MPIPFECPHCQHNTLVEDKYAGDTGPCASCGEPVTVPANASPAPQHQTWSVILRAGLILIPAMLLVVVGVTLWGVFAFKARQMAATRIETLANLDMFAIGMQSYHEEHGVFPPAYLADENGQPLHSWRVLVQPYVDPIDGERRLNEYDFSSSWDGPANEALRREVVGVFQSAEVVLEQPNETTLLLLTGPGTLFDGATPASPEDIKGFANKVAIAVSTQSMGVEWTEPRDIPISDLPKLLKTGALESTPGVIQIMMADGTHHFMTVEQAQQRLASMATITRPGRQAAVPPVSDKGAPTTSNSAVSP